jgi:hypothetical protein
MHFVAHPLRRNKVVYKEYTEYKKHEEYYVLSSGTAIKLRCVTHRTVAWLMVSGKW